MFQNSSFEIEDPTSLHRVNTWLILMHINSCEMYIGLPSILEASTVSHSALSFSLCTAPCQDSPKMSSITQTLVTVAFGPVHWKTQLRPMWLDLSISRQPE